MLLRHPLLISLVLQATQVGSSAEPPVKVFGRTEGLPSAQVQALAFDRNGVVWFATPSGLARYDGARITAFGRSHGLATQGLRTLTLLPDGRLLIGSDIGIDVLEPEGEIRPFVDPVQWDFGFVDHIVPDFSGRVWFGTAEGLVRWSQADGVVAVTDSAVRGQLVEAMMIDRADRLWVAGPQLGVVVHRAGSWEPVAREQWEGIGRVLSLTETPDGSIVLGGERGVAVLGPVGSSLGSRVLSEVPTRPVTALFPVENGVWMGMGNEIALYRAGSQWTRIRTLASNSIVNQIVGDRHGNVWVATDNRGVLKISALRRAISQVELPCPGGVFAIRPADEGAAILLGGDNCSGRLDFETGVVRRIRPLEGQKVWDLVTDPRGVLWAATELGLFMVQERGELVQVGRADPVVSAPGRVLWHRDDELWVGTRLGLAVVRQGEIRSVTGALEQSPGYVYTMHEDGRGRLWIGTIGNGLWRERGPNVERIHESLVPSNGNVYALAERADGAVAVVVDDRIVLVSGNDSARVLAESDAPIAGWSARFLGHSSLWVGGTRGLVEYDANSGEVLRRVTPSMGLTGWEFTTSRSLLIDGRGRLLAGLNEGLTVIDPTVLGEFSEAPVVRRGRVQWVNATPDTTDAKTTVRYGRWTVEIGWYPAWYIDEENLQYRYRLAGFDPDWSVPTTQASIQYRALPAGNYRLEVEAYAPLVGWGPPAEVLAFTVLPPLWATSYMRGLFVLMGGGLVWLLIRVRNRQLVRRTRHLEQRVEERTHELRRANQQLVALNRQLDALSRSDALTGVANRRQFDEALVNEFRRASRTGVSIALLVLDLDHFKEYNDTFGHPAGDVCLTMVARVLERSVRDGGDLVARLGGEEFAVLLPKADRGMAQAVAERLRLQIAGLPVAGDGQPASLRRPVTVSIGVAVTELATRSTPEELVEAADRALYRAKEEGRNRVVFAG